MHCLWPFVLEWQNWLVPTESMRPAKSEIFTIWPVRESLPTPSLSQSWQSCLLLFQASFQLAVPMWQWHASSLLGRIWKGFAFCIKGWHLNTPSDLEYESEIWMWEQSSCNHGVMNIKVKASSPEERKGPELLMKLLSSWTKANTCLLPDLPLYGRITPVCKALFSGHSVTCRQMPTFLTCPLVSFL